MELEGAGLLEIIEAVKPDVLIGRTSLLLLSVMLIRLDSHSYGSLAPDPGPGEDSEGNKVFFRMILYYSSSS